MNKYISHDGYDVSQEPIDWNKVEGHVLMSEVVRMGEKEIVVLRDIDDKTMYMVAAKGIFEHDA